MSRDTRDLLSDRDSTFIVLSIDIKDMPLRILVAEKSSFELCQNRPLTGLLANFKVEYFKNKTEIPKSGPCDFRYCPIDL